MSVLALNTDNNINICIACDNNYSKYAGVLIASILANSNNEENLFFYILDGGISETRKKEIESLKSIRNCEINFVQIDESLFEDYKQIKTHNYISFVTYYRLKLSTLLPNVDKIIYFDCDMVVNSSLLALNNTNLDGYVIAGVRDISQRKLKKNPSYVNAGMLFFNLKYMREHNIEDAFLNWTKENIKTIKVGDQTIINEVCKNKIKLVNDRWNVQSSNFINRSSYTNKPNVVHFVAKKKPWHWASFSIHKNMYFKYLQMTPWKLDEKEFIKWTKYNQIASIFAYIKYRPLHFFRPRFHKAIFKTYIEPLFIKEPVIKNNTFLIWEPCSKSHSEVIPGFTKYLLDLGYHVSVIVHPDRIKEGLFERFKDKNISINKLSPKQVKNYFKNSDLLDAKGVMVTTVGKLCDEINFEDAYNTFNKNTDKSKLFFVSHEASHGVDAGTWNEKLITLRELNYKGAKSIVVNPHYFGDIKISEKNDITNFVTIGAIKPYKKNDNTVIEAAVKLVDEGITNFKITVIGKGKLKHIPQKVREYFDIKGRLPFDRMYDELEKADFILTSYDPDSKSHARYKTTGTSGNFQLVYGFLKPCIIVKGFDEINGFTNKNSIIYENPERYPDALKRGINLSKEEYSNMQQNLKMYVDDLYNKSLNNLKGAIING